MDGKTKQLLVEAMEESAEVIQACSKAIRFGLGNHHPNKHENHADEILTEYYHLQTIIESLQREKVLPIYNEEHIKTIKKDKFYRMKKYLNQKNNRKRQYERKV